MTELAVSTKWKEVYDLYYDGKSPWRALGAIDKVQNIVNLCSRIPHDTILDIGSGEGAILQRLFGLQFGKALYSLEVSESAVQAILRRDIPSLEECRLFDGYNIPYEDRQFNLAVLSHVLEHAEYPRKLLNEASRVAEYVFIEVPLEDTVRLAPNYVFSQVGHINFYSAKTIRRLVQTCNLEVLSQVISNSSRAMYEYESGRKGIAKYLVKDALLRFSTRFASAIFTYHCALVCRKV